MPELPEVETMCRGIAPIVGRRSCCAWNVWPAGDVRLRFSRGSIISAAGRRGIVCSIERAGKRVVVWLGNES